MVEASNSTKPASDGGQKDLIEAISLGADIAWRSSSLIVISGMFYFVPSVAAMRLLVKPHEVINVGHVAYDMCKLSYLLGKGVIYRLIQVKDCILALKQKEGQETASTNEERNTRSIAQNLKESFHPVDENGIEAAIDLIEVEDEWMLVRNRNSSSAAVISNETDQRTLLAAS